MDLGTFNFIDYCVAAVLIGSGILATLRGFMRELLGLVGWIVAIVIARISTPLLSDWLGGFILSDGLVDVLAWSLPFIGAVLAWFFFANLAAPGLKKMAMGSLDRPLGFIFGTMRGIVLIALVYMGVLAVETNEESLPDAVTTSASITPIRIVATVMTGFAPSDIQDTLLNAIPTQDLDDIKDGFNETAEDAAGNAGDLLPDDQIITIP